MQPIEHRMVVMVSASVEAGGTDESSGGRQVVVLELLHTKTPWANVAYCSVSRKLAATQRRSIVALDFCIPAGLG